MAEPTRFSRTVTDNNLATIINFSLTSPEECPEFASLEISMTPRHNGGCVSTLKLIGCGSDDLLAMADALVALANDLDSMYGNDDDDEEEGEE
jgi:hypothetical protein